MSPEENLVRRLRAREKIIGVQSFSGSSHIVELLGRSGFDLVMIDTEHAATSLEDTVGLLRASSSAGTPAWVRVGTPDPWLIMKALDQGAAGVVVPRIQRAEQVTAALSASRYPPDGTRGMCPDIRPAGFSMPGWMDYAGELDNRVSIVPLIEDANGIANIRDIAAVDGIDALFFGPADFGISIGAAREGFSPRIVDETRRALDQVVEAAAARRLSVITTPLTDLLEVETSIETLMQAGVNVVLYSIDTFLLGALSRRIVGSFREKVAAGSERL